MGKVSYGMVCVKGIKGLVVGWAGCGVVIVGGEGGYGGEGLICYMWLVGVAWGFVGGVKVG